MAEKPTSTQSACVKPSMNACDDSYAARGVAFPASQERSNSSNADAGFRVGRDSGRAEQETRANALKGGAMQGGPTQADLVKQMVPVATTLIYVYAAVGGILVIISAIGGDDITSELRLSFKDYLDQMATAIGALAIGRGILANAKKPTSG
jgi:hypothetical protein